MVAVCLSVATCLAALLPGGSFAGTARVVAAGQGGRSVWDGVYAAGQAERGKTAFENYCVSCHGSDLSGGQGPALAGGTFMQRWDFRNVNQLFTEMKTRMPRNDPSSLTDATYLDIVSYVLQANAFPAGADSLKADTDLLGSMRIEKTRGGQQATELRTGMLVQVVGCLTQGADNAWILANSSPPIRTENPDASRGDERKKIEATPLGTLTFQLLGVFSPLDEHKGHRMEGRGFLVKDPGGDRISVATLEMIGTSCAR
jgi:mono/diheme cytochrome c family protein